MKKKKIVRKGADSYAPRILYPATFYILLIAWTAVCVVLLGSKALKAGWPLGQLLMVAFVLAYTWYFSLGISYRISVASDGSVQLTSFRRKLTVSAKEITRVEGPRFALVPFGFVRFRLEREKAYLFTLVRDEALQRVLAAIRRNNPEVKFKGL